MKSKLSVWIMVIMFLSAIFLPNVLWPFIGDRFADTNSENRNLAEKPEFALGNIDGFPVAYENYYNDHLPFRNALVSLNSQISKYMFFTSSVAKVQYGKSDWFFYMTNSGGNTLATWRGDNILDEQDLAKIAENLVITRDSLRKQGTEFILFVAPNKERVYSEYLPDYIGSKVEIDATEQVIAYLRENTDIRIVYPIEELMKAKEQLPAYDLYYKTDTHWNDLGAYIGTRALLKEMGIEIPELSQDMISSRGTIQGDLAQMVNLPPSRYRSPDYFVEDQQRPSTTITGSFSTVYEFTSLTDTEKTLYVHRDSFCTAMSSYLCPYFSEGWLVYSEEYDPLLVDQTKPDYFVLETVERLMIPKLMSPLFSVEEIPSIPVVSTEYLYVVPEVCNGNLISERTITYSPEDDTCEIAGWAIDPIAHQSASKVLIQVNDAIFSAQYGIKRSDVAQFFSVDEYEYSGYYVEIPSRLISETDEILLYVISFDGSYCYPPVSIAVTH